MKNILLTSGVVVLLVLVYHLTTSENTTYPILYKEEVETFIGDEGMFSAQYSIDDTKVLISLSGIQHQLDQKPDSVMPYQNKDGSITFWRQGGAAILTLGDTAISGVVQPAALPPIEANGWYWKETGYDTGEVVPAKNPAAFLLTFTDSTTFSAKTDCNNGAGSYTSNENVLTFGPIAVTKKACLGETQERDYFEMLGEVDQYYFDEEEQLVLALANNSGVMIFMPAR